jgi:KDO2-lipid IV(A) lauroyltransferase
MMVASAWMKIFLGRLFVRISAWLPLRLQRWLAARIAGIVHLAGWRKLGTVRANLARAYPEAPPERIERICRANTGEMVRTLLECGPAWQRSQAWVQRHIVEVCGRRHVETPLQAGRGVLVLGGHLGNWEVSILYGSLTLPIAYLYKPPRSEKVDRLLTGYRTRFDGEMLATGGAAMRRAVRRLRGGQAVGMLFDQLPRGGDSVQVPFFGQSVATMTLPHRLIQTTGCVVVMGHCLRVGNAWKIRFDPVPDGDDPDPQVAAAAMNRALEDVVRVAPEQYLWQYRRFEVLPERESR